MADDLFSSDSASNSKIYKHSGFSATISSSFSSPHINVRGLAWDGVNFYSTDSTADRIYKHSGFSSTILDSFSSPSIISQGLTYDGANIYSSDGNSDRIYKHSGFSITISDSFSGPSTNPYGLDLDGNNLLSVDIDSHKIYKHSGFSATISDSFSSPLSSPFGLAFDSVNIYSSDAGSSKIYKHSGFSATISDSFSSPAANVQGLAWDIAESSLSPSISLSISPSISPSASPSISPSVSLSPSLSPSISFSISPSVSPSVSLSPSLSPSISFSLSPSISPSVSPSVSLSPSLSPSISPSISPSVSPSEGISLTIEGIGREDYIVPESLRIENILTKQVDSCYFTIRDYGSKNYLPSNEDEIKIWLDADKIFAGVITRITERMSSVKYIEYDIECIDYTRLADRKLVAETYTDKTINYIINDIVTNYLSGFTVNNVDCGVTIDYIAFNYETISKCLQRLAELVGYDWYIDYDKDIHFFSKETNLSPFNLTDINNQYILNSLQLKRDTSQVKNVIYVRGGDYTGDTFTEYQFGNNTKTDFKNAYKYDNIAVTVNAVIQTVGIDNITNPTTVDCLYNFNEKIIKFRDDNKPGNGIAVNISGNPYIPVIIEAKDQDSIDKYGEFQFRIIDKSIRTKAAARERGSAEILSYASKISKGSFLTHRSGLKAGQLINVHSTIRGLDEDFIINKVIFTMRTNNEMWYKVSLVSTKVIGMLEFLQNLLVADDRRIIISEDEVVDRLWTGQDILPIFTEQTPSFSYQAPPWYTKGTPQTTPLAIVGFCQCS